MTTIYAGLTFVEQPTGTPEATVGWTFILGDVKGWFEGAPDATNVIDHWSGDGTVGMSPRLGGRTVELTGTIVATSATMMSALDAIQRARRGVFTSDGFEADVVRTELELTRLNGSTYEFAMYLRADDPLRYRAETRSLGAGSVVYLPNGGDVPAYPVVRIVGPVAGLTISHPHGVWALNHDVGAGQVWDAAFRDGDLWWGGFRQFVPAAGPTPVIPIGGGNWQASYTGSGQVTVRRFEARS